MEPAFTSIFVGRLKSSGVTACVVPPGKVVFAPPGSVTDVSSLASS
ncbi:hypothetical protein HFP43_00550 [Streptomyces sp. SJ1-7]|nr:hypothetical protein [Streptomyces sp. SJ1-7]